MKILFLLALLIAGSNSFAQKFVLKGKVEALEQPSRVYLSYRHGGETYIDSTEVINGRFRFKGKAAEPILATIRMKSLASMGEPRTLATNFEEDKQNIYLEKGKIRVNARGQLKTASVSGGEAQTDNNRLNELLKPLTDKLGPVQAKSVQLYMDKDTIAQRALFPQLRELRSQILAIQEQFIRDNPDSWVSLDLMNSKAVVVNVETFEPLFTPLSNRLKNSSLGLQLAHKLVMAKKTAVGQMAIPFTQDDTEGQPLSLASLQGKYVLIDFWASWCGPCRAENPNLVKAYEKYKPKNFEILGVSLDDKKAAWLAAIKKDGLTWLQVSDLKGWENVVAKEYGVTAVPMNYLLGPDGKILAKNLRGEALEKKLEELLN